jgi:hypothetical protein
MSYSSRFFLYGPFALLLVLGAAAGVNWWFKARALEQRLDAMLHGPAMPGVRVGYRAVSVGGFPFRLEAVFDDFRVEVATARGPLTWRAEHFAFHELTYGRDETIYEAAGRQSVAWGAGRPFVFQAGALRASAIRDAGGLRQFDLDVVALVSPKLVANHVQFHIRRTAKSVDVFAAADDARLSQAGAFGDRIVHAAWQGSASAPEAFDGARAARVSPAAALEAWRNAQGSLGAEPVEIDWGGLDMMGHGALSLDEAHRPAWLIDFKIAGIADWLRRDAHGPVADAVRARAAAAGANEAGKLGIVFGARDGIVYLGDRPAGMAEPLY